MLWFLNSGTCTTVEVFSQHRNLFAVLGAVSLPGEVLLDRTDLGPL